MEVIKKRRAELNEKKVFGNLFIFLSLSISQARGEDILTVSGGKRRRYLDFIDILLEAQVSFHHVSSLVMHTMHAG